MSRTRIFFIAFAATLLLSTCESRTGAVQPSASTTTLAANVAAPNPVAFEHRSHPPRQVTEGAAPAIFIMHGYGSNMADMDWLPGQLDGRYHCINLQAPMQLRENAWAWYSLKWHNGTVTDYDRVGAERIVEELAAFVQECVDYYNLDPKQLYFTGFSQGSIMSLDLCLIHPELVAGAVVMSGRLRDQTIARITDAEALKGKPMLMTHGVDDAVIPIDEARTGRDKLKPFELDLEYQEYPGGHTVTPEVLAVVQGWFSARQNERK